MCYHFLLYFLQFWPGKLLVDRTLMMKIPATQMNEFCTRRCRIFFLKITNLKFDTKTSCWCWWLGCSDLLSCNLVSSNKCDLVSSNTQTQLTMSLNTCRALSTFTITIRVNSEWFSKNLRFLGGCVDQGKLFFCCCKTLPSSLPIFDRSICISICGNCQRGSLTSLFLKYFFETSSGW